MKLKTISGHYDTAFNIDHNNRIFIPRNVDERRIHWNYYCVAAGQETYFGLEKTKNISAFWMRYKELNDLYKAEYAIAQTLSNKRYQEHLQYMRAYCHPMYHIPHNSVEALLTLLLLPLLVPCGIYLNQQHQRVKAEWEQFKEEQWVRDMAFKAARVFLRSALYTHDLRSGTAYLQTMDAVVKEMGEYAGNYPRMIHDCTLEELGPLRFATLEEIYDRLYEPSFREFQKKQRPCRRYDGTYLEQIREGRSKADKKVQQSKNTKNRKTAEAIEIVFMIGDMDNTGYANAVIDAKRSEEILGDFYDHLLEQPNLCYVTTEELEDPNWEPPFKNGLIILNLTLHADESNPGVHLTCIPYSRDCKRGPKVQASMGKALAGMGYPSTWKDVLDDNGERIPKKTKNGDILYNKDGSIRYKQEPDQQGIIDWIEDQKRWIHAEMKKRYDWEREYKGSHPRGNLSTPDYQVARAKERNEECKKTLLASLKNYQKRVDDLTKRLNCAVEDSWHGSRNKDIINRYLEICSDEEYDNILHQAEVCLDQIAVKEHPKACLDIGAQIRIAKERYQDVDSKLEDDALTEYIETNFLL